MDKTKTWLLNNYDLIAVLLMVVVYSTAMSYLSILRHNAFASSYDLANTDQTVWNSFKGTFFSLSGGNGLVSRFNYHADLILILICPIYLIWDDVRMLLIIQSVLIGLTAVPIWLIGKHVLKNKLLALGITGTFLLNPTVQWANLYDFHGVTVAMVTLLFCFYFGLKKQWWWMYTLAMLSAITKEEISLVLAMFGVILCFWQKEKIHGFRLIFGGLIWFGAMTFIVIPFFSESGTHWAWDWFKQSNNAKGIFSMIIGSKSYFLTLFSQWMFLPAIGLPWSLTTLPDLMINALSSHGQMRSTVMHYESGIMPGMVLSTVFAIRYVGEVFAKINKNLALIVQFGLVTILVLLVTRLNYFYSPLPTTPAHWRLMYQIGSDEIEFEKVLQSIPKEASITASSEVRNHITHRFHAYNLPDMVGKTDYIALVDQNRIVGDYEPKEFETKLIMELKADERFVLITNLGHFYLYKMINR